MLYLLSWTIVRKKMPNSGVKVTKNLWDYCNSLKVYVLKPEAYVNGTNSMFEINYEQECGKPGKTLKVIKSP